MSHQEDTSELYLPPDHQARADRLCQKLIDVFNEEAGHCSPAIVLHTVAQMLVSVERVLSEKVPHIEVLETLMITASHMAEGLRHEENTEDASNPTRAQRAD